LLPIAGAISDHIFLWGFPEIIAPFITKIPEPLSLVSWLTWYYKNSPSVIRGWRSSQNACLHLSRPGARLYPEHFLNAAQQRLREQGKLRYMPGPTSVIEEPLIVGFVGRREKTGHPSQKPVAVFEKLILMTTAESDLVFDPMCGSGTTGDAVLKLGRRAILSDISEDYTRIAENRLGISRLGAVGRVKPHRAKRCPEESAGALFDQHGD
jgi:site-specific DNA-methyltransferase (adenine-specific)